MLSNWQGKVLERTITRHTVVAAESVALAETAVSLAGEVATAAVKAHIGRGPQIAQGPIEQCSATTVCILAMFGINVGNASKS